jgi:hypothetical protein
MGWRGQNAYDMEEAKRLRSLPWRERYNWRNIGLVALVAAALLAGFIFVRQ